MSPSVKVFYNNQDRKKTNSCRRLNYKETKIE